MSDLVSASRDRRQWKSNGMPLLVGVWWILWLIVNVVGNATTRQALRADTLEALQTTTTTGMAFAAAAIPLYVLARQIVVRVWRDQSRLVET